MKRRLQLVGLVTIVGVGLVGCAASLRAYVTNGHVWAVTQIAILRQSQRTSTCHRPMPSRTSKNAAADWNTQAGVNVQLVYSRHDDASSLALDYTNNVFFRNDSSGAHRGNLLVVGRFGSPGRCRRRPSRKLQVLRTKCRMHRRRLLHREHAGARVRARPGNGAFDG